MTAFLEMALALDGVLAVLTGYMYWQDWRHRDHDDQTSDPAAKP